MVVDGVPRWRGSRCRTSLRWLAFLLVTGAVSAMWGTAPAAAETPGPPVKYYVVGGPVNGQAEYLYDIAVRTLGTAGGALRSSSSTTTGRSPMATG
jgi:hypothetical protein